MREPRVKSGVSGVKIGNCGGFRPVNHEKAARFHMKNKRDQPRQNPELVLGPSSQVTTAARVMFGYLAVYTTTSSFNVLDGLRLVSVIISGKHCADALLTTRDLQNDSILHTHQEPVLQVTNEEVAWNENAKAQVRSTSLYPTHRSMSSLYFARIIHAYVHVWALASFS